jgi:glycosyltransferase involved in cell wall biosynthesis
VLYLAVSGERIGGAETQLEYLVSDLDRARYEPIVLTPAGGGLSRALEGGGVSTAALAYPHWRRRTWLARRRARPRLIALARERGVALVHGDFNLGPYLVAMAEALGVPSVLHVRRPLQRGWVRRYALHGASALIAIGRRYRDQLVDYGIAADRIVIIQDATDLARFTPDRCELLRRQHPVMSDRVLLGMVGRLEPFKRQLEFLQAAERVMAAGRQVGCFVVGAANRHWPRYVRRLRAFPAAHGMEDDVVFTGRRTDIEHVIASLDVLVTLSGGSVMLEAMACGIPVVTASDDASRLEIVRDGEAGLVVPDGDPDALVRALLRLCDDAALRQSLGAQGRQRAVLKFGRARLARETERVYESLLARRPAPSLLTPTALDRS